MDMLVCINLLLNIVLTYIFTRTAPPILHAFVHFSVCHSCKVFPFFFFRDISSSFFAFLNFGLFMLASCSLVFNFF